MRLLGVVRGFDSFDRVYDDVKAKPCHIYNGRCNNGDVCRSGGLLYYVREEDRSRYQPNWLCGVYFIEI